MELTQQEFRRYSRHLTLPQVGVEGQLKFKAAKVLLVGAGGLGSPIGIYLAAAGIGKIGIVDFDVVEESNLQRQIAHGTEDVGRLKLESIKQTIQSRNPFTQVEIYNMRLQSDNVMELFDQYDVIVDGSDNFATRYLVNDAAYFAKKPLVYSSILEFQGQISVFQPGEGPCYRCMYAAPPPEGVAPN